MQAILALLEAKMAYLRWAILLMSWIVIAWSVHHLDVQAEKLRNAEIQQNAAKALAESQVRANKTGSELEKKLSDFETKTRGIDDAKIEPMCYFNTEWVQQLSSLIDASNSSRKRAGGMPRTR